MNCRRILAIAGQGGWPWELVSRESDKRGKRNESAVRSLVLSGQEVQNEKQHEALKRA